jgi:hypothetical protein
MPCAVGPRAGDQRTRRVGRLGHVGRVAGHEVGRATLQPGHEPPIEQPELDEACAVGMAEGRGVAPRARDRRRIDVGPPRAQRRPAVERRQRDHAAAARQLDQPRRRHAGFLLRALERPRRRERAEQRVLGREEVAELERRTEARQRGRGPGERAQAEPRGRGASGDVRGGVRPGVGEVRATVVSGVTHESPRARRSGTSRALDTRAG